MSDTRRGSRKHVLDWVAQPEFVRQVNNLLGDTGAVVDATRDCWMPTAADDTEARLERENGRHLLPGAAIGDQLADWWLVYRRCANTPNWDLVSSCRIEGTPGLVLVEAKAHISELVSSGKNAPEAGNPRSQANHNRIGSAIDEARAELDRVTPGILIARDTHYQLSNRVAFAWKVASLGVPVVLVYLGFLGDTYFAADYIHDAIHWQRAMADYIRPVLPAGFTERDIQVGKAGLRMIVRARPILEMSPPREGRNAW